MLVLNSILNSILKHYKGSTSKKIIFVTSPKITKLIWEYNPRLTPYLYIIRVSPRSRSRFCRRKNAKLHKLLIFRRIEKFLTSSTETKKWFYWMTMILTQMYIRNWILGKSMQIVYRCRQGFERHYELIQYSKLRKGRILKVLRILLVAYLVKQIGKHSKCSYLIGMSFHFILQVLNSAEWFVHWPKVSWR